MSADHQGEPIVLTAEALESIVPRVPVDEQAICRFTRSGEFSAMAFELYKETASLAALAAGASSGAPPFQGFPRNQAICVGLLVRVCKFMTAVMQLVSGDSHRREVVMALSRSVLESATDVRYLIAKDDPAVFDQFVMSSLTADRDLYDLIQQNIAARNGERWPIEERMLWSIDRTCRLAGVAIADVKPKTKWIDFRSRLIALDDAELYVAFQRIASHAVHGTWTDLILHHLEEMPAGLGPDPEWAVVDARLFCPQGRMVLEAVHAYVAHYLGDTPDTQVVIDRVADLSERLRKVDAAHEAWMSASGTRRPGEDVV